MKILNNKSIIIPIIIAIMIAGTIIGVRVINQQSLNQDQTVYTSVSWSHSYANIQELTNDSTLVALGKIDKVLAVIETNKYREFSDFFTDYSFMVDKVITGKDITQLSLHQTGASGKQELIDDPLFNSGEQYILFLKEYEPGKYFHLAPQGRYKVINNKVFSMNYVSEKPLTKNLIPSTLDVNGLSLSDFIGTIPVNK